MTRARFVVVWLWLLPVMAALVPAASVAEAADGSSEAQSASERRPPVEPSPDFFLGQPRGWVAVRGGMLFPRADGDLFTFVSEQLTLSRSDFRARDLNLELGFMLTPAISIEGGFDLSRRRIGSEYRNFVRASRQPITQTTTSNQSGGIVGVRFTPSGHGQRISQFAFIPRRLTPYAAAGLQLTYASFAQRGDFVDFEDRSIFSDVFASDGWAFGPYVRGGVDLQVWRRLHVNGDVRYTWMRSDLSLDFTGFDGLDLAGVRGSTGISVKF